MDEKVFSVFWPPGILITIRWLERQEKKNKEGNPPEKKMSTPMLPRLSSDLLSPRILLPQLNIPTSEHASCLQLSYLRTYWKVKKLHSLLWASVVPSVGQEFLVAPSASPNPLLGLPWGNGVSCPGWVHWRTCHTLQMLPQNGSKSLCSCWSSPSL